MNIEELEKLARAAKHDNDSLIVGPAAILELIEQHKALVSALETAQSGLQWYYDAFPQHVNESDDEAIKEIETALARAAGSLS